MTKNAKARALLGMNHWRSNTQKMFWYKGRFATKTGNQVDAWCPIRTKTSDCCYGELK